METQAIELPDLEVTFKIPESGEIKTTLVKWREGVEQFKDDLPKEKDGSWEPWWAKVLPWVQTTYGVSLTASRFNQIDKAVYLIMEAQEKRFFDGLGSAFGITPIPGPSATDKPTG